MAVVAGLDSVAPVVIATPGILPYTLIPAANGQPAYTAFLLWRDRHTSSLSSSTFWGHMICPSIKTDNSALDTVCRTFSSKTRGIWGMDVGILKYIQPGGKGRSKREQKEDSDESHSRIRSKIVSGKGTTLISTSHHLIYILPIRYIDLNIINAWCREEGECTWIPSQDLFTAFRSDSTNANLIVNTHDIDDVTRQLSYSLYLPFSASIRTPETMREILEILSQFEVTLNTSTTIASSTPSPSTSSTSTSTSTPTCIYTCRKCRTRCFTDRDLVLHEPNQSYAPAFAGKRRDMVSVIQCSSHFIEPVPTLGEFSEASGRILCPNPKCGVRIGDYDWAGSQCSCGEWITPALQITQSKVDRKMLNMANVIHIKPLPEQKMIHEIKVRNIDEKNTSEISTPATTSSSATSSVTSSPATEPVSSSTTVVDPIHTPSSSPAITAT